MEPEDSLPYSWRLPLVPVLGQTNSVHTLMLYLFKMMMMMIIVIIC
jgi:hypothetical protein